MCLYSGQEEAHTGRYSFIGWQPQEECTATHWSELEAKLSAQSAWHENAWFGWLSYDLRHETEQLPYAKPSIIPHPSLYMVRFLHLLRFDHHKRSIEYVWQESPSYTWQTPIEPQPSKIQSNVAHLQSNLTKAEYIEIVDRTIEEILAGHFYQANITRKFFGTLQSTPNPVLLFRELCQISPAPYSAFIKKGEDAILSSSPECFLSIDTEGNIVARPIKGSIARAVNKAEDAQLKATLQVSAKDNAENRMIVDLMRNDLARTSTPGSVMMEENAKVYSYATIHHLIPTIKAKKLLSLSTLEVVKQCFPPGSMTGAPKIAAMRWCSSQEPMERGIYSGAIGWFGGDGSCDLSVVIRTLLLRGQQFEFQVGGGIVADSTPEKEWMETLVKARGLCSLLGIMEETLAAL